MWRRAPKSYMDTRNDKLTRVLALYPSAFGFGYAVFEGEKEAIAFGVKVIETDKNKQSMRDMKTMIEAYRPDVIILEDYLGEGSRKCKRVQTLIESIIGFAHMKHFKTRCYSRAKMRGTFTEVGAFNKQEIAEAIVNEFPEFGPHLPPKRSIYKPESARMSMFDAAALALTYYFFENGKA